MFIHQTICLAKKQQNEPFGLRIKHRKEPLGLRDNLVIKTFFKI